MLKIFVLLSLAIGVNCDDYQEPEIYQCPDYQDGATFPVTAVCFAYFQCQNGEALYQECPPYFSFNTEYGICVEDNTCFTACPENVTPNVYDITKYFQGGEERSCAADLYFNYRFCTCTELADKPADYDFTPVMKKK